MSVSSRLSAARVLVTLAAFLVAAVCVRLGIWQLDRRVERLERNAEISERMSLPGLDLAGVIPDTTGLIYRVAEFEGEYDVERGVVLAGRSHQGAPGVHLLYPLRLADGGAILVHRGWLPAVDGSTVDLGAHATAGPVHVRGLLLPFPDLGLAGGRESAELEAGEHRRLWYRMDGEALRRQLPYPVSPLYLQEFGESGASDYPLALPLPELDPGPHLGYAIQWFSFATIALVGWGVLLFRGDGRAGPRGDRRAPPLKVVGGA